jgi:flagellar biogenesis protein FliO
MLLLVSVSDVAAQTEAVAETSFAPAHRLQESPSETPVQSSREALPPTEVQSSTVSLLEFVSNALPSSNNASLKTHPGPQPPHETTSKFARNSSAKQLAGEQPSPKLDLNQQARQEQINLTQMLKQIGSATLIVLAVCCVSLIVVKRMGWANRTAPAGKSGSIRLLETHRISNRSQLKLVEIDQCRFLVALDGGCIKSVQAVNKSFSEELEALTETETDLNQSNDKSALASQDAQPQWSAPLRQLVDWKRRA